MNGVGDGGVDFGRVHALVCEPSPMLRQGIRIALNNLGIRQIAEATTITATHEKVGGECFDLLVLQSNIEHTDATGLLRLMRAGSLGRDPFAVAVLLLTAPTDADVRRAVNSGADDALLVPFAPDQLRQRIAGLASRRKPFVVTHDYIGPDRRQKPRPNEPSAMQVMVPNPLHARATGRDSRSYEAMARQALEAIAGERIKRLAAHAEWECKGIHARVNEGRASPESTAVSLYRLETVCDELATRIQTHLGHSTGGVEEILGRCKQFRSAPDNLTASEAEAMLVASRRICGIYVGR